MNKQQKPQMTLKDKKTDKTLDIIAFSVMTSMMLFLTVSFYRDIKSYPDDSSMKCLTGVCAAGTCLAGYALSKGIKQYRDIKKELAQKAKENQK